MSSDLMSSPNLHGLHQAEPVHYFRRFSWRLKYTEWTYMFCEHITKNTNTDHSRKTFSKWSVNSSIKVTHFNLRNIVYWRNYKESVFIIHGTKLLLSRYLHMMNKCKWRQISLNHIFYSQNINVTESPWFFKCNWWFWDCVSLRS